MAVSEAGDAEFVWPEPDVLGALEHAQIVPYKSSVPGMKRYVAYFVHRYVEYRLPEVEAVAGLCPGKAFRPVWELPQDGILSSPFWPVHLPDDAAVKHMCKSLLLTKSVLEVWGEGTSLEEMLASVAAYPNELKDLYSGADQSFKFVVESFGVCLKMEEQVALMETLEPSTQLKGKIDLKTPRNVFWLLMTPGTHGVHGVPQMDAQYYFGREVGTTDRSIISKYDLRYRRYLGPTSMDTEMAFIMCNIGKVAKSRLVLDPFVGTGSILIAAAHMGALTLGTDIDMRVIKLGKKDSKGRAVNLYTNFADYGLQSPVGLLRSDAHRPPFRSDLAEVLDAVVCDPPYGVRAGGRKGGQRDYTPKDRQSHYVSTDAYPLGECLADLLESSARLLRVGGRLVYFLPAMAGYYDPAEIPAHPMLRMVSNSEQFLSRKYSRRLVAMEKVAPYDAAAAAAHRAACGKPTMLIDHLHQHVYQGTLPEGKSAS